MKKIYLILAIIFFVLTILGGIYVLANEDVTNPGYAIIPMLFCGFFNIMHTKRKKDKVEDKNKSCTSRVD